MSMVDSSVDTLGGRRPPDPKRILGAQMVHLLDRITKVLFVLSGIVLFLIMAMYLNEIVMRYLLNSPTVWSIDIISFSLAAMVSLAAPELARTHSNISITILPDMIKSDAAKARYNGLLALISAVVIGSVCYVTAQETLKLYNNNILTVGTFIVPKWYVSVFIPVGLFFTTLQYIRHVCCSFSKLLSHQE